MTAPGYTAALTGRVTILPTPEQASARVAAAQSALTRAEHLHERPGAYQGCVDEAIERARTELAAATVQLEDAKRRRREAAARALAYTAPGRAA